MSKRTINFYAGPAGLPLPALERAKEELLDFAGTGMSVMEISHRAKEYDAVHEEALALTRELMGIPANYKVLLLQGGAHLSFAMIPLNLLRHGQKADYLVTGNWAEKAYKEAKLVGGEENVKCAGTTKELKFARLPKPSEIKIRKDASFVHFTSNDTVEGTQWHTFPETGGIPYVCDMSSDIMWRPFDVKPFGLIYAGARRTSGLLVSPSPSSGTTSWRCARPTTCPATCATSSTPRRTACTTPRPASASTSCATCWPTTSPSAA